MSTYSVGRNFDGAVMGSGITGRRLNVRVFAPAWWQVWRWVTYWRAPSRGRVTLLFMGRPYELRCIGIAPRVRSRRP
jgi:hypothetical protein